MITLFRAGTISPLTDVKEAMAAQIKQLPLMVSSIGNPSTILRYEMPCEPIDELAWLHNQRVDEKIYWADRATAFAVAGIGAADILKGEGNVNYQEIVHYITDRLSMDNTNLCYYGGFNFDADVTCADWKGLSSYRFIVPQFEILTKSEDTVFAFNISVADITEENIKGILLKLDSIDFSPQTKYRSVPVVQSREDLPSKKDWAGMFKKVFDKEGQMRFEKIVLARKSIFSFDKEIDPMALVKHLKDITPHCYHFCFQTETYHGFLGASPEKLYKRTNTQIESEAIAGTRPRGKTEEEDDKLGQILLQSAKDAQEHKFVVDQITDALKTLCTDVSFDKNSSLLKLKEGQHLVTRFSGDLKENADDEHILSSLHPTPAVGGCPMEEAVAAIKEIEPFARGWYAAPVGYIGYDKAEFAVAIRSGLVNDERLSLFAGAGIVDGSSSDDEWQEIENKISSFIKVFDL